MPKNDVECPPLARPLASPSFANVRDAMDAEPPLHDLRVAQPSSCSAVHALAEALQEVDTSVYTSSPHYPRFPVGMRGGAEMSAPWHGFLTALTAASARDGPLTAALKWLKRHAHVGSIARLPDDLRADACFSVDGESQEVEQASEEDTRRAPKRPRLELPPRFPAELPPSVANLPFAPPPRPRLSALRPTPCAAALHALRLNVRVHAVCAEALACLISRCSIHSPGVAVPTACATELGTLRPLTCQFHRRTARSRRAAALRLESQSYRRCANCSTA
jgi:hypothetical protein